MSDNYKEKVGFLLKLQGVELKMASIQAGIESLPSRLAKIDEQLAASKDAISAADSRLSDLQQTYRSLESDTQTYQGQIEKSLEKIKLVKTNKEYQSSLKETEDLKALQSKIEDKMIQCLEDIDLAEAAVDEKKTDFNQCSEQIDAEKESIRQEFGQQEKELIRLGDERSQILGQFEPELLETYNAIKQNCGGVAVAVVRDAVCQACYVNIPPQMFNELHKFDRLSVCPHCQRIIYPVTS